MAWTGLSLATPESSVKLSINAFIGNVRIYTITRPRAPLHTPIIKVSALNTLVISFFLAPNALNIPISFVLSNTEI